MRAELIIADANHQKTTLDFGVTLNNAKATIVVFKTVALIPSIVWRARRCT
jgi:hypothetical protein